MRIVAKQKLGKEHYQTLLFQQLAKTPNGAVIGHTIGEAQAHETAE
jgi:hypothetical protein